MDEQQKPDIEDSQKELEAELKEEELGELAGGCGGVTAPIGTQNIPNWRP